MQSENNDTCPLAARWVEVLKKRVELATTDAHILAEALGCKPETIHTYFARINEALGTHSRFASVLKAIQQGWLPPPPQKLMIEARKYFNTSTFVDLRDAERWIIMIAQ